VTAVTVAAVPAAAVPAAAAVTAVAAAAAVIWLAREQVRCLPHLTFSRCRVLGWQLLGNGHVARCVHGAARGVALDSGAHPEHQQLEHGVLNNQTVLLSHALALSSIKNKPTNNQMSPS
jgi:hypothetical protein